jgi:sugar phosphate isomerase/epimerase
LLAGAVRHVHIKDARRIDGAPADQPWEPVLLGEGDFPARELVALLRENDYQRLFPSNGRSAGTRRFPILKSPYRTS